MSEAHEAEWGLSEPFLELRTASETGVRGFNYTHSPSDNADDWRSQSGCVGARASLALHPYRGPGYVGIKGVIAAMHARHYSVHISRQIRLDETTTGL